MVPIKIETKILTLDLVSLGETLFNSIERFVTKATQIPTVIANTSKIPARFGYFILDSRTDLKVALLSY